MANFGLNLVKNFTRPEFYDILSITKFHPNLFIFLFRSAILDAQLVIFEL